MSRPKRDVLTTRRRGRLLNDRACAIWCLSRGLGPNVIQLASGTGEKMDTVGCEDLPHAKQM